MTALPIDKIENEFSSAITTSHLVVEAETGSGKSTRLPIWAAKRGRVLVIEPRRIACTSLAEYLALQDGSDLGKKIGYAIKLETRFNDNSHIVFVTPGVALRWFADNKLAQFDIVLVDEFHERRWDIDLLVALLRKEDKHRLIVTSATIEGEKLAKYIGAQRLVAEGRQFNVGISYQARDSHYLPDSKNLERNVVQLVSSSYRDVVGDILVFLPGRKEITQCAQALSNLDDLDVVMLHGSVSDHERYKALHRGRQKKVVLATNIAETSLTIPNITWVIDSGLERRTLQRNGRTVLSLRNISKASAKQRAGRAGRVMDGECIRLYGEHAPLELVTPPELLREELTEAMLASVCCGYPLSELDFLNSLPEKSLAHASDTLTKMQAIDSSGAVTEHGRRIYPLPIDVLYADLITRMPDKSGREAIIDLAAALSVPSALYQLPKSEEKLDKLAKWEPDSCDGATLIRIVRGQKSEALQLDPQAIKEARGLSQQMRSIFALPDLEVASRFQRQSLLKAIIDIHPELLFVRREKRRQALGNGFEEVMPARNSRFAEKDEAALVLDQHSIPGRGVKQTLNLATLMMPVPMSLVIEREMGEWVQRETVVNKGEVYSELALVYAGRTLTVKNIAAQGDLLLKPLVDAVVGGNFMPGFFHKRSEEINHWRLYVELGLDERHTSHNDLTFEKWFSHQLREVGISDAEEMALFTQDDFPFDGIPYWEYENFAELYPYQLNIGDLQLKVEYMASKKRIYVIYHSGLRKGDPKRWELPKWQGWRIQYKKASRIIDIK